MLNHITMLEIKTCFLVLDLNVSSMSFFMTIFFHCCQTTVTKGRLGVRASQSSSRVNA